MTIAPGRFAASDAGPGISPGGSPHSNDQNSRLAQHGREKTNNPPKASQASPRPNRRHRVAATADSANPAIPSGNRFNGGISRAERRGPSDTYFPWGRRASGN